MEENLKMELHSVKLQLNSTMKNNKIFEETVTTLKHEFKQKESKFLTDFFNLKHLNNKLENKLHSQDQSIQIVHMMLNHAHVYDQRTKTALGAQNPFHLRQAKKAQPALYDGEELLKTHHVSVNVPSSEEELELAKATRNKLYVKMNDFTCVEKRVNITPPNYSKENFMATFTPQTQLTPEQVFWSLDIEKRKAEELKANAPPLPVLPPATVYPPNTPVHLVPRTLPTTSQVNIGLYVITQLFWDFEKTCKKRITPTGITEGERGFEQTKRCYLTEVIPFFNLLKEHFDGVQKSLVTEVRAMKAVFENLEAEVDQNEIDLKSGEIERKNLLITNENLIAECLSKDVFYTATDSVLNVSRFSDMHDAFTIAQKRIADLESENFNLRNKIQNDDHDSMIKHFSKLEVEHFNLQLKYQNLKERFGNKKPVTSSDAPSFDSLFMIGKLNEQIQISQNKDLTAKLNALHDLNELFRAENAKVKQHYKELYDSIKITRAKTTDQNNSLLSEIENLKAQLKDNSKCVTIPDNKPKVLAPGRYPIDVEPIPPKLKKNQEVHLHYIKHLKENVETLREIVEEAKVKRPLDTSCIICLPFTLTLSHLNTPPKVLPIKQWKPTGRLLPLGRQCPLVRSTALTVSVKLSSESTHKCFVRDLDVSTLIKESWLWHRRLNHLNFGTLNDLARKDLVRGLPRLKFEKDHLCSACQLGKSRKATHKPKTINTITEVLHTLHMDLCGPLRVQSINGKKYILVIVDDYSRFTWVKFLRSKDETPVFVINLLKQLQVGLNKTVRFVRTDNGTEFVNKNLTDFYESVGITHEKTVPRTPQQNGVVERRNRTLVEAARTMLIFSKAPLFLWAEAVATAFTYTSVSIPVEDDSDISSPGVNGPPIMPEDPYAYIMAAYEVPPSFPPSPDYISWPPRATSTSPLDFVVPRAMYPEYIPQEDEILPAEEQPLPTAASPTADSPGYVPKSDPKEDRRRTMRSRKIQPDYYPLLQGMMMILDEDRQG
ncbi:retrovirus-related pol polyprotein from transposon TNT 1-94 [Tanacetum coccineum]